VNAIRYQHAVTKTVIGGEGSVIVDVYVLAGEKA
jgi:hypothetical protein